MPRGVGMPPADLWAGGELALHVHDLAIVGGDENSLAGGEVGAEGVHGWQAYQRWLGLVWHGLRLRG